MKILKNVVLFVIVFFVVCIFSLSWHQLMGGFCLSKISPSGYDLDYLTASKDDFDKVKTILEQKFKYLDRGCQVYVFLSEDNQYVLKLIRYDKYKKNLRHFLGFKKFDYEQMNRKEELAMQSYKLAFHDLQNETQTLFIHLNKTDFINKKLTIVDRLNRSYLIDLDNVGFIIQKKGQKLDDVFKKLIEENDQEAVKKIAFDFLEFKADLCQKGIQNIDNKIKRNLGMIDSKFVEMDLGNFRKIEKAKDKRLYKKQLKQASKDLTVWISKNYPGLSSKYEQKIDQIADEKFIQ